MGFFGWLDGVAKKLRWYDISAIKLSVFGFTLLLVKFYPQAASLAWQWYAALFVVPAAYLLYITLRK